MRIIIENKIIIPDPPPDIEQTIIKNLTIPNPKWIENDRLGRWNKGVNKTLEFYIKSDQDITIPRGYMRRLINACHYYNTEFTIEDKRRQLDEVPFKFKGTLKPFQKEACNAVMKKHFGVLTAPTGAGKTVMMLYIIAQRRQPALIIVHTKDLAMQWINRINQFLDIPENDIGFIGSGHFRIGKHITVAMVQSLYKKNHETSPHIGHIIVDECHRAPSRTFTEAVSAFDSYYMTGLSATPFRRDRLSKLIFWHIGDPAFEIDKQLLEQSGDILKAEVIFRITDFNSETDPVRSYSTLMSELISDDNRNTLIASDVAEISRNSNGVCLILSDRKAHCNTLKNLLKLNHGLEAQILTGDLKSSERKKVLEIIENNKADILIATSQLIGEGFDSSKLSTLFLAYPVKFSGRLIQYLGRILRPGDTDKKALVYDYVDQNIGVLEAAARSRYFVYNASHTH